MHQLPGLEPQGDPRTITSGPRARTGKAKTLYQMLAIDVDGDGVDEIALGTGRGGVVCDAAGKQRVVLRGSSMIHGQQNYSMQMLDKVPTTVGKRNQIVGVGASVVSLYDADGTITKEVDLAFSPAGMCYDLPSGTLLLGSGQSGGDCIYCVRINQPGWDQAVKAVGLQGKLREIVNNVNKLTSQIEEFQRPPDQPAESPDSLCDFADFNPYSPSTVAELDPTSTFAPLMRLYQQEFPYPNLRFAGNHWLSENANRSNLPHGWDRKRDIRMAYQLNASDIVNHARRLEQEGLSFVWTIGHGNDPFFLSLPTVEAILVAAPTACKGFVFPEIARDDTPAFRYAVEEHVKPICDLCPKHGNRKVFLRSKFLFWIADCRTDMWRWILEDKKYQDVIVPAMEETYERLCDLSLSGRVGLQQAGYFSDWAGRAVLDNPCYDREHQWAATMVGSQSVEASHNSHGITRYQSDPPWVFSRLECFWGQAPTPEYDFGYYSVGRRRQALNFLPTHRYGLIPIMPSDATAGESPRVEPMLITDGELWYDSQGKHHTAQECAQTVEETLRLASEKMWIRVDGDVPWTATRLDQQRVFLVLIDSGYLDPADRITNVHLDAEVITATDILSREKLDVRTNAFTLTVPMGILRVIDLEHR